MSKEMNAVELALHKAWTNREKQLTEIASQVQLSYQWIYEALTSAREASDGTSGWLIPNTPCLKKRKLEPDITKQDDEPIIEEAKKPRKLKRNAKETKRKNSKGRTSTRSQSKAAAKPARASTRVTRATAKFFSINDSPVNSVSGKSKLEVKEDTLTVSSHINKVSNTTKSFCEHEADMEINQETTNNNNKTFDLEDKKANNDADNELSGLNKEPIAKETEDKEVNNDHKNPDPETDNQEMLKSGDFGVSKVCKPVEKAKESFDLLSETFVVSSPILSNQNPVNHEIATETPKSLTIFANTSTPNTAALNNPEHTANSPAMPSQSSAATQLACKQTEEMPKTNTPKIAMPQIARIKEQLFEKIKSPASEYARKSPRLNDKTKSPARVVNTPERVNSPAGKKKIICQIDIGDAEGEDKTDSNKCQSKEGTTPCTEDCEDMHDDHLKNKGPKIFKPIKPKNVISGVHSMIKAANQKVEIVQGPVAKQNNVATGIFSFIKSNAPTKAETVEERKQRLEEDVRKREETRKKLLEQAEIRRQKEMDDRKRRRQEREQRVADAQAKKAQAEEERIRLAQERFDLLKKNEERARKQKEKEEETKKRIRERKMAEVEAKRKQEDIERKTKLAEKEEDERRKADYLQRKHEFEEQERKKKIEEQRRVEEERLDQCARERQLQEERIRRDIEERDMMQKKRQEERLRKEKEEKELLEKKKIEREKREREVQERIRREKEIYEKEQREKEAERERKEQETKDRERKEKEAKEIEKKQREAQERKEREIKERKEKEARERKEKEAKEKERMLKEAERKELKEREKREKEAREAYYKKKLEQKKIAEHNRTVDKAESQNRQPTTPSSSANKLMHPPQLPAKVQCTSYKTPTLAKVKSKIDKTKSPSLLTYDIDNLSEDDSTDDEECPAQDVPIWAKGEHLKKAVSVQIKTGIDPYEIFVDMLEPPKLEKMFPKMRARFFKRTSSACWDHPPRPFKTML